MWLSLSMIMLERSCLCGSIPPTSIPYFSTSRKPGVVLRVPATTPRKPHAREMSFTRFDLRPHRSRQLRGLTKEEIGESVLCRDATPAREHSVERDSLAEEIPRRPAHGRDVLHGL